MAVHILSYAGLAALSSTVALLVSYGVTARRSRRSCPSCTRMRTARAELVDTLERAGGPPTQPDGPQWRA